MLFIAFEGAFRLWSEPTELSIRQANEGSEPPANSSPDADLASQVLDQLKRGRKIRGTAPVSSDGTSGPIDVWEQDATMLLENAGRHDLATRFETRIGSARARGLISGVSATRARMDRKLRLLSEFAQELDDK